MFVPGNHSRTGVRDITLNITMGIPCYFVSLIRKYPDIMRKLSESADDAYAFYLDSNSIVYDCLRRIDITQCGGDVDGTVIDAVLEKLDEYIAEINPGGYTFIAFDGVAPLAKTTQQRERRYRTALERSVVGTGARGSWNTSKITPGTPFMARLMQCIRDHYACEPSVILNGSEERGEGEQKIFEHVRATDLSDKSVVIYGLDADLIMLGLLHTDRCGSLALYRETPVFIRSVCSRLEPLGTYLLDIGYLGEYVAWAGGRGGSVSLRDYVFLCFLLGNDFLPHFPSLSLRDGDHDVVLRALAELGQSKKGATLDRLTNGCMVNWPNVRRVLEVLAKREETAMSQKESKRARMATAKLRTKDDQSLEEARLESVPTKNGAVERFIAAGRDGWAERYYRSLVGVTRNSGMASALVVEYLRGLEWTWTYYTAGCKNWQWKYPVSFPPLLVDVCRMVPAFAMELMASSSARELMPDEQLLLVLPTVSAACVADELRPALERKRDVVNHKWSFCRYFWEGAIEFRDDSPVRVERLR